VRTADSRQQTADSRQQTADSRQPLPVVVRVDEVSRCEETVCKHDRLVPDT
jgi:hypothetical protein